MKEKLKDTLAQRIAKSGDERPRFGYRRLTEFTEPRVRLGVVRPGASNHEKIAVASAAAETISVLAADGGREYAVE
jgi:hypothetical protein